MSEPAAAPERGWMELEAEAIAQRRAALGADRVAPDAEVWGLALSGGGIRSATFSLGVIKAMARNGLLTRFDYLSTVSGGGYAGAALGRLFQAAKDPIAVERELQRDDRVFWWWLRSNGRYLFPAGFRDSLFAMSTLLRGIVAIYFDLFLLALLLSCVIVAPHLLGMELGRELAAWINWSHSGWWLLAAMMPALLLAAAWAYWISEPGRALNVNWRAILLAAVATLGLVPLVAPELAHRSIFPHTPVTRCEDLGHLGVGQMAIAHYGCLTMDVRVVLLQVLFAVIAAVPLAWIAGRSADGTPDLSRARNWLTQVLMRLLALTLMVVMAALVDMASWWIAGQIRSGWPAFAKGGAGLFALLVLGRAALKWIKDSGGLEGHPNVQRIAGLAGYVFAFLFLLFCATLVQMVVFYGAGFGVELHRYNEPDLWSEQAQGRWFMLSVPVFFYVMLTGGNIASLNASSLHNFYKARLSRSYVSVGNPRRGFDPHPLGAATPAAVMGLTRVSDVVPGDDLPMAGYRPHAYGGPVHLVNVCVNQTMSDRTREFNRDRKGRNMTVSGVGCDLGAVVRDDAVTFADGKGLTLGQWIAISGAAAAPGMGSHTSKGLAALMTLCGVRLGYWLEVATKGGRKLRSVSKLRELSPKYVHLMDEAFATFPSSEHPHWYVSDGGHFENTGIYALLKREAALIVAADCGADPGYAFGDLNNLVRLARIDFNANITFLQIKQNMPEAAISLRPFGTLAQVASSRHASYLIVAQVSYASGKTGHLVILKPAIIHTLPLDLHTYKSANPTFPQQTTADQFFDEAQWESYFRLGEELGAAITLEMLTKLPAVIESHFVGQLGTGLAREAEREAAAEEEKKPRFAGEVVKSSLGIGAVAGLLIALWQTFEQSRVQESLERRQHDDAIAKALEKSVDGTGRVRVSDNTAFFLRTIIRPNEGLKPGYDYTLAERLVKRLQEECEAETTLMTHPGACAEIKQMADVFESPGGTAVIAYWPGAPEDKQAQQRAQAVVQRAAPTATAPKAPPAATKPPEIAGPKAPEPAVVKTPAPAVAKTPVPPPVLPGEAPMPAPAAVPPPAAVVQRPLNPVAAVIEACERKEARVKVYPHVYRDDDRKVLEGMLAAPDLAPLQDRLWIGRIQNVLEEAAKTGAKPPYVWSQPTILYHHASEQECATQLAALYGAKTRVVPSIRALPERLRKQAGTIEVWIPPPASAK